MEDCTQVKAKLEAIQQWQKEHEVDDHVRFSDISGTLKDIKENHLAHIQIAMERMAVNYDWVKYLLMGIIGGIGTIALAFLLK